VTLTLISFIDASFSRLVGTGLFISTVSVFSSALILKRDTASVFSTSMSSSSALVVCASTNASAAFFASGKLLPSKPHRLPKLRHRQYLAIWNALKRQRCSQPQIRPQQAKPAG
jgi:hypothetical protein